MLRFLGAKVVLTPAAEKGTGMLNKADGARGETRLVTCAGSSRIEANAGRPHEDDSRGDPRGFRRTSRSHYFVSGFGTGGTMLGRGPRPARRRTRRRGSSRRSPTTAQVLGSGIPQPRDATASRRRVTRCFRPHLMQGWSPDFISDLTESARSRRTDGRDRAGVRRRRDDAARAAWPGRKVSSSARPAARRSRRRWRSPSVRRQARTSSACCRTPASVTCRRRCSVTSRRR